MDGKSLPHFMRIGGKQVGAETGLLSGLFASRTTAWLHRLL
jgi:hypothetical protein